MVEAFSVASVIEAADAAVKAANVQLLHIHLAMAIGGKGFVSMTGDVASVHRSGGSRRRRRPTPRAAGREGRHPRPRPEIVSEFI